MLDIGGGIGALLLYMPAELVGTEPELTALDGAGGRVHTEVRERRIGTEVAHAALYPALPAGRYRVDGSGQVVEIAGAMVTEARWEPVATSSILAARRGVGAEPRRGVSHRPARAVPHGT
ncbi:MAG TPA: hypothetical protein VND23_09190 [Acidimicrobiales bacterium]|nr:hypothetical protein [Acidimicrobiales bacterium]